MFCFDMLNNNLYIYICEKIWKKKIYTLPLQL